MDTKRASEWVDPHAMESADRAAAAKMLLILVSMAFGLSVFVLLSIVFGPDGEIKPLYVSVWVAFTGACLLAWRNLGFKGKRWIAVLFLALLAGRWVHAWLFAQGPDVATGILVGILYTPMVLMISILMSSGQNYPLGFIAGSVMGLVPLIGGQREAVAALEFADWRLGPLVFFMLALFGAFVDIWVRERRELARALRRGTELDRISKTDALTGVWNRRGAEDRLAELAAREGSFMGLVPLIGGQREAVAALEFADWRLGPLVFFMLALFGAFVDIWVRERRELARALRRGTELDRISKTDALTGVWNRRGAEDRLAELATREGSFTVFLCDIDRFKSINDRFGHVTGDSVLVCVAASLAAIVRPDDVVARWGGEEFLVAIPAIRPRKAARIADRLRREVIRQTRKKAAPVTITIGVAVSEPGEDMTRVLERADRALYQGKADGRNATVLASLEPGLS